MSDLLRRVVRATASSADVTVLLDRVAHVLSSESDWVLADRLDDPDLVARVAAYDRNGPLPLPDGARRPRRSSASTVGMLPALLTAPHRLLRLERATLLGLQSSADVRLAQQATLACDLGVEELLVLGIVARESLVGVLSIGRLTSFSDDDVEELLDIALHVGLALDAAHLLAMQREVATVMQTSLLPGLPVVDGLRLAARYTPAAKGLDVGGDWFDAFPTPDGFVMVIGDASGHDLAAAARMADLRNLLRAHAVDRDEGPASLISRLERTADVLSLDATATLVVARVARDPEGWRMTWSSAGHLPPVLFGPGRAELLETPADLMLGVLTDSERTDHELLLRPGEGLLLFTDGLVEVRGCSMEERLELLRSTVQRHAGRSPDALAEELLTTMAGDGNDDVALLVLEVDPS